VIRPVKRVLSISSIALLTTVSLAPLSTASDFGWVAQSGLFSDAANWAELIHPGVPLDLDGVPDANDTIIIRRGAGTMPELMLNPTTTVFSVIVGSNNLNFSTSQFGDATLTIANPTVSLLDRGLIVGQLASDTDAVLTMTSAGGFLTRVTLSAAAGLVAPVAGSKGTINVAGGGLDITGSAPEVELPIGYIGTGTLDINTGGHVNVSGGNGDVSLGENVGADGTVNLSGKSAVGVPSSLNVADHLYVGKDGHGVISVSGGASLTTGTGEIGSQHGSMGSALIEGHGTSWNNTFIRLGNRGTGFLSIRDGARVVGVSLLIGQQAGSGGTLIVDGIDSRVEENLVVVGSQGTGMMTITGGGKVLTGTSVGGSSIAPVLGSSGTVLIDGLGSAWSNVNPNADPLIVGGSGGGSALLIVQNQGSVSAPPKGMSIGPLGVLRGDGFAYGDVTNNGAVEPGTSPGTLTINGNFTQNSGGRLRIDLGGPSNFDQLIVSGNAALGGTLELTHQPGTALRAGDSFDILVSIFGTVAGTFGSVLKSAEPGGINFDATITYHQSAVTVTVTSIQGVAGDYTHDGLVDAADYTIWRDTLGQTGISLAADGNGDNVIDAGDYTVWMSNFGNHAGAGAGAIAAVPEPSTFVLLLTGILTLGSCRRCRKLSPP
jgi:T5SS/PEP-CTERM-associated repeat protein